MPDVLQLLSDPVAVLPAKALIRLLSMLMKIMASESAELPLWLLGLTAAGSMESLAATLRQAPQITPLGPGEHVTHS